MNRMPFLLSTLILVALTAAIFWLMWRSWQRRKQRDRALGNFDVSLQGDLINEFERVFYVATTPAGEPLERIALAGLEFRGWSSLAVFTDGVSLRVTGETPVTIPVTAIAGEGQAQLTIDKVVERDGLSILVWESTRGTLESVFRFGTPEIQQSFATSVETMLRSCPDHSSHQNNEEA